MLHFLTRLSLYRSVTRVTYPTFCAANWNGERIRGKEEGRERGEEKEEENKREREREREDANREDRKEQRHRGNALVGY